MANEQTSVPLFAASEVLTAANMNISAGTGVPVFATTITRDAAFGGAGEKVLAEGQLCYLSSTNVVQYYDGAAWATVGPAASSGLVYLTGASFTSATTISMAAAVFTATYKTYEVIFQITSGSAGTIGVRVNNAGTPRTGADYVFSSVRNSYNTDSQIVKGATGTSINLSYSAANNLANANLKLVVFDPTNASTKTKIQSTGVGSNDSDEMALVDAAGTYNATAEANDGLTFVAGAAVTGFYRVYGLSES